MKYLGNNISHHSNIKNNNNNSNNNSNSQQSMRHNPSTLLLFEIFKLSF